jgi:hypothetical protein
MIIPPKKASARRPLALEIYSERSRKALLARGDRARRERRIMS